MRNGKLTYSNKKNAIDKFLKEKKKPNEIKTFTIELKNAQQPKPFL